MLWYNAHHGFVPPRGPKDFASPQTLPLLVANDRCLVGWSRASWIFAAHYSAEATCGEHVSSPCEGGDGIYLPRAALKAATRSFSVGKELVLSLDHKTLPSSVVISKAPVRGF
eukprot:GEZU01029576.1.p1 GENE.GEZU01029576.1~~GEZU01029576.1.p1  ORF type:complete len:113 (+),score=0.15 GEZU01029576.1:438-776(+)